MKAVLFRRFGGTAPLLAPFGGRKVRIVTVKPSGDERGQIGALMAGGRVEAVVERTFPITEIADAHAESAGGRVRGKIGIRVQREP